MSDQRDIFEPRPLARRTDPDTSHIAAASMDEPAKTQRLQILRVLADGKRYVHSEIDELLNWPAHTANRRLPELRRMGLVHRLEEYGLTNTGRWAHLYEITSKGRTYLEGRSKGV